MMGNPPSDIALWAHGLEGHVLGYPMLSANFWANPYDTNLPTPLPTYLSIYLPISRSTYLFGHLSNHSPPKSLPLISCCLLPIICHNFSLASAAMYLSGTSF